MVILNPTIGGDATKKRLDEIKGLITSQKGEIVFEDDWGMKDIAYTMGKHDRGYYYVINFNMDSTGGDFTEMDTTLRLENEVIRHMLVKVPSEIETKTLSQFQAEAKEEQEAWDAEKEKSDTQRAVKRITAKKETKPAVKKAEASKETAKASSSGKKEEKEEKKSTEDVDAKLKSIIDNPDLNF